MYCSPAGEIFGARSTEEIDVFYKRVEKRTVGKKNISQTIDFMTDSKDFKRVINN